MDGEGKRKRRAKTKARRKIKARIKIVVHQDKIGKYVIVNRKKFRLGKNVSKKDLNKFVTKKVLEPKGSVIIPTNFTPSQDENLQTTASKEAKVNENMNKKIADNNIILNQAKLERDLERDRLTRQYNEQHKRDEAESNARNKNIHIEQERAKNEVRLENQKKEDLSRLLGYTVSHLKSSVETKQKRLGHSFGLSRFSKQQLIDYLVNDTIPTGIYEPSIPSSLPGSIVQSSSSSSKIENKDDIYHSSDPLNLAVEGIYTVDEMREFLKSSDPDTNYNKFSDSEITKKFDTFREQQGFGERDDRGLSNFQIDKIMLSYPEYLGTISHDEVKSRIIPKLKPKSRGGFVINTDPESKPGEHWQAVFWDARPKGDNEIDFYDSYGDPIDKSLQKDLLFLARKLNAGTYLKLKENKIGHQNNRSSNCGWFAVKFLMDRFRGKHFQEASGWDDAIRGEKNIERFKHQHGGHFGYIPSFQSGKAFSLPELREDYPPAVRKYLVDTPITSIQIARAPISSGVNTLLNVVTFGGWQKALSTVGIDKALHLKMVLNGNTTLERNHVVQMYPGGVQGGDQVVNVPLNGPLTFKQLLERTKEQVGPSLQRYDPVSNNCQVFLTQVLKANGLLTPALNLFINQNIEGVFKNSPSFLEKVAKTATDIAHRADTAIHGKKITKHKYRNKYGGANLYELQGIINPGST